MSATIVLGLALPKGKTKEKISQYTYYPTSWSWVNSIKVNHRKGSFCNPLRPTEDGPLPTRCSVYYKNRSQAAKIHLRTLWRILKFKYRQYVSQDVGTCIRWSTQKEDLTAVQNLLLLLSRLPTVPPDLEEGKHSTHDEPDVMVSFCQENSLKSNVF